MKAPVRVTVTGAAGQIGYALLFLYVSIFQVALLPLAQIILGE